MNKKLTQEEMELVRDRLSIIADELSEQIDDVIGDKNRERATECLKTVISTYNNFVSELNKHPFIVVDTTDVERIIDALIDGHNNSTPIAMNNKITVEEYSNSLRRHSERHDHLGFAAEHKQQLKKSLKNNEYNIAWSLNEKIKSEYLLHAQYNNWNQVDTLRLVGSVFEASANILRVEGKHLEAFRHFLYYSIHSAEPSNAHLKKLKAYINRASLPKASVVAAMCFVDKATTSSDFEVIDEQLKAWE